MTYQAGRIMYETTGPNKRQRMSWDRPTVEAGSLAIPPHVSSTRALDINHILSHPIPTTPSVASSSQQVESSISEQNYISNESIFSPATTTTSLPDEYATNPRFLELQEELRSKLFTGAQSAAPSRAASPGYGPENGQHDHRSPTLQMYRQILCTTNRLRYLKNYINEVAPWLDMFDVQKHFGIQIPLKAQRSPTLLYAMLALSARHIERKDRLRKSCESLELYSDAIQLLTPLLASRNDEDLLATSVLLCCLEMMSAGSQNWRRHLGGCAAIFQSYRIHGFSGGLKQAIFWCYTRMDLSQALISDGMEGTVLPLEAWIPDDMSPRDVASKVKATEKPDMHANYAVYLCSNVNNFLAERTQASEYFIDNGCSGENFVRRWRELWHECQQWVRERPTELVPIKVIKATSATLFPFVLFAHWAAISSNQLIHTACILLLNVKPASVNLEADLSTNKMFHARRIVGISNTNLHEGCLNNSLQPLWTAGRLLSHRSEHKVLVQLIRSIESRTGWGISWRIKDLEESWGYERGELDQ